MMMLNVASELSHLEKYRFIMLVSQVILDISSKAKQKNSISKVPMRSKSNHSASFSGQQQQQQATQAHMQHQARLELKGSSQTYTPPPGL